MGKENERSTEEKDRTTQKLREGERAKQRDRNRRKAKEVEKIEKE